MALVAHAAPMPAAGWLRNRDFDLLLIGGLTFVSLLAGAEYVFLKRGTGDFDLLSALFALLTALSITFAGMAAVTFRKLKGPYQPLLIVLLIATLANAIALVGATHTARMTNYNPYEDEEHKASKTPAGSALQSIGAQKKAERERLMLARLKDAGVSSSSNAQ